MTTFYAVATPGLEPVVAQELHDLGVDVHPQPGGVHFEGPLSLAWLCTALRTPARLRVVVVQGKAHTLDQLASLVSHGDWTAYLRPGDAVDVSATSRRSRLRFKDAVAAKVERAIMARTGRARHRGGALQHVNVHIDDDLATVSVDAGGERLHRRGWRQATAKAPLRENLAASLLVMAGFTGDEPLLDPFCGAGTIPIEAALLAAGLPPGVGRDYACSTWPGLSKLPKPPQLSRALQPQRAAPGHSPAGDPAEIFGSDRDPGAMRAATANAARAAVQVSWQQVDLRELQAPSPTGLIVTNPPYGARVGGASAGGAYAALGMALRGPLEGWRAIFLAPDPTLARKVDRRATQLTTFSNGGIKVGVWAVEG